MGWNCRGKDSQPFCGVQSDWLRLRPKTHAAPKRFRLAPNPPILPFVWRFLPPRFRFRVPFPHIMKRLPALFFAATLVAASASAQDWARERIEKSPRHLEWVTVKHDAREVGAYIGYPEVKDKATAVIVIHEIYGVFEGARSVVDEFAEAGYIAIAPDLLWGLGAKGGVTSELNSTEERRVGKECRSR